MYFMAMVLCILIKETLTMGFNLSPYLLTISCDYIRVFSYHRALINNAPPPHTTHAYHKDFK